LSVAFQYRGSSALLNKVTNFSFTSQGSINKFNNSHPLRERARKLKDGILVIRFEAPYHFWCDKCESHIAMGVRFNAEKKAIGNYFSTKIWSFKMKCPNCSNQIEFQTDPKNAAYVITNGGKKKTETFDASDAHTMKLLEEETKEKLDEDPFFRLEHLAEDKEKAVAQTPWIEELEDMAREKYLDDYANNRLLRQKFREEKKEEKQQVAEGAKLGLNLRLLPATDQDSAEAAKVTSIYKKRADNVKKVAKSIFGDKSGTAAARQLLDKQIKRGFDVNLLQKANRGPKIAPMKQQSTSSVSVVRASSPSDHFPKSSSSDAIHGSVTPGFSLVDIPE
jgi:coiled-coil domain-containing protein 130